MGRKIVDTTSNKTSIATTPRAKNTFNQWMLRQPLRPQQGLIVGALIEWFCKQDPIVTTAIMANVDHGMEHAYAAALRQLADEIESQREPTIVIRK